jgi:hypothetical protein
MKVLPAFFLILSLPVLRVFRLFEVDQMVAGDIFVSYTFKLRNVSSHDGSASGIRVAFVLVSESVDADTLGEEERLRHQTSFLLVGAEEHQDEVAVGGPDGVRGSTFVWGSTRFEHHGWITR